MGNNIIRKLANAVDGATTPRTSQYEVGSYKAGKTQADGFGRKAIGHVTPKQTETYDNTPHQGFKPVKVGHLEVGSYTSNRKAGNTPSEK